MQNLSFLSYMMWYVGFLAFEERVFMVKLNKDIRKYFKKYQSIFYQKGLIEKEILPKETELAFLETSMPLFMKFWWDYHNKQLEPLLQNLQSFSPSTYGCEPADITISTYLEFYLSANILSNNLHLTQV